MNIRSLVLASLALILFACDSADPTAELDGDPIDAAIPDAAPPPPPVLGPASPPVGSLAGYYPIAFDFTPVDVDPARVVSATIGGIAAYDLTVDGPRLSMTVQGAPEPGPAEVVLILDDDTALRAGPLFTYAEPVEPRIVRIASIGASLGQGVQRGVPSTEGALMAPGAQVARALGAYMPLPVPLEGLLPQIGLDDVGPPPDCDTPSVADFIVSAAASVLPQLVDPETRALSVAMGRVDPTIDVHNVSVGNASVADVLYGPTPDNIGARVLSHLVYEPFTDPFGPVARSQLDVVEDLQPDVVISVDLYGNDLINGIANSDDLDPDANSPLDVLHADLAGVIERLGAMNAQVFIADLPRPSVLARAAQRLARAEANGDADEYRERLARIDGDAAATNDELRRLAAEFDNVHVVPLAERVEEVAAEYRLGGVQIDVRRFGGLVGLDGVHFTHTGYALVADLVLEHMGLVMGFDPPRIDVERVYLLDPEHPDRLREAGFDWSDCLR